MNLKSNLLIASLLVGSVVQANYIHVNACEHNPIGGVFKVCSDYCGSTGTPYHAHIAGIAGSPLLGEVANTDLTKKVVDYITYGGATAKHAILRVLAKNPAAHNNPTFTEIVKQQIERQKEIDASDRRVAYVMLGTAVCIAAVILIGHYCKDKDEKSFATKTC